MIPLLHVFWRDQRGATMVEYGVLAALLAVVLIAALSTIGTGLRGTFNNVANGAKG